ncbi:uncharacterized protein [Diadema antillarum]|uniref:uncharacterized protein n=1 Tax=Diadema antillarum TaxID=105358 RepID=UPI003A891048
MSSPGVKTNMESDTSSSDIARNTETTALTKTQQLSDGKKQGKQRKKKKQKRVTVTVGTTGGSERVAGLIALLRSMVMGYVVNYREIPYNVSDMDQVEFDDMEVFILCHSITNRRLSITDVTDSLYDQLLGRANRVLGKENVIIVAYDYKDNELQANVLGSRLETFKIQQPTACSYSSVVVFAGECASSPPELPDVMLEELRSSLQASNPHC